MKPKPLNIEMHIYGAGIHGGAISPAREFPSAPGRSASSIGPSTCASCRRLRRMSKRATNRGEPRKDVACAWPYEPVGVKAVCEAALTFSAPLTG